MLFVLFPLMILTGLAMSPSMNAAVPFLADVLGGRQTARTIHFVVMLLLVGFFVIHILMILAAGPINELQVDRHRLVSRRRQAHPTPASGAPDMPRFMISRRKFLTASTIGAQACSPPAAMRSISSATATIPSAMSSKAPTT